MVMWIGKDCWGAKSWKAFLFFKTESLLKVRLRCKARHAEERVAITLYLRQECTFLPNGHYLVSSGSKISVPPIGGILVLIFKKNYPA